MMTAGVIRVEFTYDSDPDKKYDEVLREINNSRSNLPEGIIDLHVQKFTPSDVNILQVALVSQTAPYKDLEKQAESYRNASENKKPEERRYLGLPSAAGTYFCRLR
jgi:multidrug efflux pump subunit AcrB